MTRALDSANLPRRQLVDQAAFNGEFATTAGALAYEAPAERAGLGRFSDLH